MCVIVPVYIVRRTGKLVLKILNRFYYIVKGSDTMIEEKIIKEIIKINLQ